MKGFMKRQWKMILLGSAFGLLAVSFYHAVSVPGI